MNHKKAKELRREARKECAKKGIPQETTYTVRGLVVEFAGAQKTLLRPMSRAKIDKEDTRRDRVRATRAGVVIDWALQEVYDFKPVVAPLIELGDCERRVIQRTKKLLSL